MCAMVGGINAQTSLRLDDLVLAATVMLVSTDSGPPVAEGTGLFDVFGYGGLLAGTVLLLRVTAAVARDGTV